MFRTGIGIFVELYIITLKGLGFFFMLRFILVALALCSCTLSWSNDLVVSTQPIYLISKAVTQGIEQPKLLLANQSGHDITLSWIQDW